MYILLVAEPGIGKSIVLEETHKLLVETSVLKIAPASITKASLVDALAEAARSIVLSKEKVDIFHCLQMIAEEFGVLVHSNDNELLNFLNHIWDCPETYTESRRHLDEDIYISRPTLNMIAGTQPAYLGELLPEGAWRMGFCSRTIMVYAGEGIRKSLFSDDAQNEVLGRKLLRDLEKITTLYGQFVFLPDAGARIDKWHLEECTKDGPSHTRLANYSARRIKNLLKLCMVESASNGDSLQISLTDVENSLNRLRTAETYMEEIFKTMAVTSQENILADTFNYTLQHYMKEGAGIVDTKLKRFIASRVPANQVNFVVATMIEGGMIKKDLGVKVKDKFGNMLPAPNDFYIPITLGK